MPTVPEPAPPEEQLALRQRLEDEWVDLSDMAHVLDSVESTLITMLGTDPVTTSSS